MTEVSPCDDEFISTVSLVPTNTVDFRPVTNLKPLNQFVEKIHFKMDNIRMALNCVSPGDFMVLLTLRMLISVYLFSNPIVDTYVFFGISSVMSLIACLLGTVLHPGFSLRFLSMLRLILGFLALGLLFSLTISYLLQALMMSKGGKFLKKLWCCVGGEYNKIIWFYQLG